MTSDKNIGHKDQHISRDILPDLSEIPKLHKATHMHLQLVVWWWVCHTLCVYTHYTPVFQACGGTGMTRLGVTGPVCVCVWGA